MEYIFDIDLSHADQKFLLSSSSDNCLRIYDTERLEVLSTISAHKKTINSIEFSRVSPFLLYSCSSDHSLCMWDTRAPSTACFSIKVNDEILSFSTALNDSLLALSLGLSINFFDIRRVTTSTVQRSSQWRLGEYGDVHSDIVTQLKFHPSNPTILASGGEDGLVCMYDVATDPGDEVVMSILNTDAPVRKLGFFGPSSTSSSKCSKEGLFALSTTEIPSFWHYPSAQRIAHYPTLRESLSLDYFVNCFFLNSDDGSGGEGSMHMIAGRFESSACIVRVSPDPEVGCCLHSKFASSAHTAMVRCVAESTAHIFTGAEDGKICVWKKETILEGRSQTIFPSISTSVIQSADDGCRGASHRMKEIVVEEEEVEEEVPIEMMAEEEDEVDDDVEDEEESNDRKRRKRIRCNNII
eukprot:gene27624-36427_t